MKAAPNPIKHVRIAVGRTLHAHPDLLPVGSRIVVAVSGGQDSLCLLDCLRSLQPKRGWMLAIAHCNHGWRADASANAEYVERLAATWSIPFLLRVADRPLPGEAAARAWRYAMLTEMAIASHASRVVTGHTRTDRAETLLYHLLRGSGAEGLTSLPWRRSLEAEAGIDVVRPLLCVDRADTAAYCQAAGLRVWEDPTNADLHFARNRIRLELMPYLRQHFNPQIETALTQLADLLQADTDWLEREAERFWLTYSLDSPRLDRVALSAYALALQRRIVRQWLRVQLQTTPDYATVEKVRRLVAAPNRSRSEPLPGGSCAIVQHPWICLPSEGARSGKLGDN